MPKNCLKKIKLRRSELGYNQEYMGANLGITQCAYGKIERGKTELTLRRLKQIALILDVDVNSLIS